MLCLSLVFVSPQHTFSRTKYYFQISNKNHSTTSSEKFLWLKTSGLLLKPHCHSQVEWVHHHLLPFLPREKLFWNPICFPWWCSSSTRGSTLKGKKKLLLREQMLYMKSIFPLWFEMNKSSVPLGILVLYPFTLNMALQVQANKCSR